MNEKCFVLLSGAPSETGVLKLLTFYGVHHEAADDLNVLVSPESPEKIHLMMGYKDYLAVSEAVARGRIKVASLFVYEAGAIEVEAPPAIHISDKHGDICGEFSGLSFTPAAERLKCFDTTEDGADTIMSTPVGAPIFLRKQAGNCPLFMLSTEVQDVGKRLKGRNDVVSHAAGIVPLLMYLNHAAPGCFGERKKLACIIIDDPQLHPEYGYLNYMKLVELMEKYRFHTTIAFIPWNYRSTHKRTAELFRENPDKLSICVHGCDHTRGEYASDDGTHLKNITKIATHRMAEHEKNTGVPFDKVMVFPQGSFSNQAMDSLKQSGYWAAINTSPISVNPEDGLELKDCLGLFVGKYGGFPLFPRNTPDEIFAISLNLFMNRPVFIVIHHEYLKDDCARLIDAVTKINALASEVQWDGAGRIVKKVLKIDTSTDRSSGIDANIRGVVGNKGRACIFARRHASVLRDKYLSKSAALMSTVNYFKKHLHL